MPMARGFVYLGAVVDVFSRRVLAHRVSITMEADFCVEALEEALAKHGKPKIFNTDQGSQFTSVGFTRVLLKQGVSISMDGKGSWRDDLFVERLVAQRQIRGGLSESLRQRERGARPPRTLPGLLQSAAPAFEP